MLQSYNFYRMMWSEFSTDVYLGFLIAMQVLPGIVTIIF